MKLRDIGVKGIFESDEYNFSSEPLTDEGWELKKMPDDDEAVQEISRLLSDMEGDLFDKSGLEVYYDPISGDNYAVKHGNDYYVWNRKEAREDNTMSMGFEEVNFSKWPPSMEEFKRMMPESIQEESENLYKYYMVEAEHMNEKKIKQVASQWERIGVEVLKLGAEYGSGWARALILTSPQKVDAVREMVWELNGGNHVRVEEISEDEAEEHL